MRCNTCQFGYDQLSSGSCIGLSEIVVIGGLNEDILGKPTQSLNFKTDEACNVPSFFEYTSRDGLNDGVTKGMVCDYVHGKALCCGGEFGLNGGRVLLQKDCMSLEETLWTNATVAALPEGLRFPSSTVFNDGTDDKWLITGGEGKTCFPLSK